jgi:zinc transporter, ZIP family
VTARELALMAIPALVALAGGFLAALWHPSARARSLIQHFAAGVVLAALAVELLPEIEREHAPGLVLAASFALGSLFMYGLKLFTERLEKGGGDHGKRAVGLLLATFIDVATDGFIIGAGFAAGGETGPVLAIGLSVELLFLGLALTSEAPGGTRIVLLSGGLGATVLACAAAGKVLLSGASKATIGGALAFSAAALLYLVTEELLMEAHAGREPETPASTLVLFAGFLAFWTVQLVGKG